MSRILVFTVAALAGLAGSLAATLFLYRSAAGALNGVLEARLRGAGESGALWLGEAGITPESLRRLMRANSLDGAYVVTPQLSVPADATGARREQADLLRVDPARVERALRGEPSVATTYELAEIRMATGYFPVRDGRGRIGAVLALEAGDAFSEARGRLERALAMGVGLSVCTALGLGFLAASWSRSEARRREQAARAARGEALARVSAMAAHEIRNPLGVIRGTVELMRLRSGGTLGPRDQAAMDDVLGEVERLRRLTEDLLDLSADRPLESEPFDLGELLDDAAAATEAQFPSVRVALRRPGPLPVRGDRRRLRQVFANLLANAAEAQKEGEIVLGAEREPAAVRAWIADRGPGIPGEILERLFEPFVTSKASGTGLGLALSKRLVERHGGALAVSSEPGGGTVFEVRLPLGKG